MITVAQCLAWTAGLLGWSLLVQSLEWLRVRKLFADRQAWDWSVLALEFRAWPRPVQNALGFALRPPIFNFVLVLRCAAALSLFVTLNAWALGFLLFSTLLICFRFRGTYNGGSDTMTVVVLMALLWAATHSQSEWHQRAALWYVAIQCGLSYFLAGAAKIRQPEWRRARALQNFLELPEYEVPEWLKKISRVWGVGIVGTVFTLCFELSFPAALVGGATVSALYLGLGIVFHLGIAYTFGLNRFLWAWLATYPAVLYCAGRFWL